MKAIITIVILAIIALILVPEFFYIVDQTKQAVVLRFGEIKEVSTEPGLHTKQPFVDKVVRFDKRLQIYDVPAERIFTKDKKTLLVDTIAVWKIVDPEKFVKTMKSVDLALTRIDDVVYSIVRNTFGKLQFDEVISGRGAVLEKVTLPLLKK